MVSAAVELIWRGFGRETKIREASPISRHVYFLIGLVYVLFYAIGLIHHVIFLVGDSLILVFLVFGDAGSRIILKCWFS